MLGTDASHIISPARQPQHNQGRTPSRRQQAQDQDQDQDQELEQEQEKEQEQKQDQEQKPGQQRPQPPGDTPRGCDAYAKRKRHCCDRPLARYR